MKTSTVLVALILTIICLPACNTETVMPDSDIPTEIKDYVSTHFPTCTITKAVSESDENEEAYEVSLSCSCKLEFDKSKNIIDIDCSLELPSSVVPEAIRTYVQSHYPNNYIIGWELQGGNQEVLLDHQVTLVFDMQGTFIRTDT